MSNCSIRRSPSLCGPEIGKLTTKPISEVIVPDYHPDRSGGSAHFRRIGARIVSTRMTYELLLREWEDTLAPVRRHDGFEMGLQLLGTGSQAVLLARQRVGLRVFARGQELRELQRNLS